jgi:hypothetical protein
LRGIGRLGGLRFAILSVGGISLLLSVFRVATELGLPFHFGYTASHINLTLVNGTVDMLIWTVTVLVFSIFPIINRQRGLAILLVNGAVPFSILLLIMDPRTFPALAVNNILAVLINLNRSQQIFRVSRSQAAALLFIVVFFLIIAFEVLATFSIAAYPVGPLQLYEANPPNALIEFGRISLSLFYLGDTTVGFILILLMFSPIVLMHAHRTRSGATNAGTGIRSEFEMYRRRSTVVPLALLLGLAAFAATLPYLLHPVPIGVDASFYLIQSAGKRLSRGLVGMGPWAAYIVLLFILRSVFQLPAVTALAVGAAFLSALSAIGAFFFAREAVGRTDVALLSALLASFSPQLLVGTFAGIFEAWLAYSESLLFLGLILHAMKNSDSKSAAGSVLLSILILLTHPWTWAVLILILVCQLIVISAVQTRSAGGLQLTNSLRIQSVVLIVSVLVCIVVVTLVSLAFPYLGNRTILFFEERLRSPVLFVNDIALTLTNYVGGFYSNWILMSLVLIGLFGASQLADEARALLLSWVLVPGLLSVFFSSDVQWRLLYLLPYSVLAAYGILSITSKMKSRIIACPESYIGSLLFYLLEWSCIGAIALIFWNNLLRSMFLISASF